MNDWMGSNNSALAIVRVSSRRQEGNISHETQEQEIRAYCSKQGLELKEVHRIVESAQDSDFRKQFSKALSAAITSEIRHICYYMYDREARNLTDIERFEKLVRSDVVVLHYIRDNKVFHQNSPDGDFFMRDVQAVTNKHFIRNLRAKVNDAMTKKAESGWHPSNHVPLGYALQRIKDDRGRELKRGTIVVRDPNEMNVRWVIREFELRAQGYSFEEIRTSVIAEGLVPAEKIKNYWKNAIEKRINNPFYSGRIRWKGKEYPAKHELIIPPQLVDRARRVRRRTRSLSLSENRSGIFAGGWIRCGECDCAIVYDPKKKVTKFLKKTSVFHYYHCSNGKKHHASMRGLNVTEEAIWSGLEKAIDAISVSAELAREIAKALNDSHKFALGAAVHQLEHAKKTTKALEAREDQLYEDMVQGVIDQEGFRRMIQKARSEKTRMQAVIDQAQSQIQGKYRETASSIIELCRQAKSLYLMRSPLEKREFLEIILSNPRLNGASVEFDLKKPFSTLALMSGNEKWRTLLDDFRTECAAFQGGYHLEKPRTSGSE